MEDASKSKPKGGWVRTIFAYAATLALFLFYANFETSHSQYDTDFNLVKLERIDPIISSSIGWGALVVALTLLILASVSFQRSWLRWPGIGLLIGFAVYPYSVLRHTVANLAPWTIHGQVQTDNGTKYVFCDSSFLQGQTMALAKVENVGMLKTSYRVLVDNNGDSPRSWASLIRPDKCSDKYGQLYQCNDFLIGVRYDNRCFLAYDLKNKMAYGHGKIETLSPFAYLPTDNTPSTVDVARTCQRITEYADFCATTDDVRHAQAFLKGASAPGCPPLAAIRTAISADEPLKASAARTLLACYDEARAKVRSRIGESRVTTGDATEPTDEREPE